MQILFNKYHGAGNDFIIIDNRKHIIDPKDRELVKYLCDRHRGIGSDGLILVYEHDEHDFEMKYYNSDGMQGSMCGNGGRCAAAYAEKSGITREKNTFMASDGLHYSKTSGKMISISIRDTAPPSYIRGNHFINTGSPHYIVYVSDHREVDVVLQGRELRNSEIFAPDGTNVNFVEQKDEGIYVRTYERGVEDETLSCGTGVTAAAISSQWDKGEGSYKVKVNTPGGVLSVSFELRKTLITNICLSGPAEFVFSGILNI